MRSSLPGMPRGRALPTRYEDARADIATGDVLMYRGRSLVSRVICAVTGSPYSHAGMAVWWSGRLMVMEAVGRGVIVTPLSANVRGYHGDVEWFQPVHPLSAGEQGRMVDVAQAELGKEYAQWRTILLGLTLVLHRSVDTRDRLRRERRLFCSHYIAQIFNAVGRDLKCGVSDRFMSPGDIARSPLLRRIAALRRARR
jgi:hypothetical protein